MVKAVNLFQDVQREIRLRPTANKIEGGGGDDDNFAIILPLHPTLFKCKQ
jgi:hypothetical protein